MASEGSSFREISRVLGHSDTTIRRNVLKGHSDDPARTWLESAPTAAIRDVERLLDERGIAILRQRLMARHPITFRELSDQLGVSRQRLHVIEQHVRAVIQARRG